MAQNGGNIDLIDDIYFTFLAHDFRMPADDYAIYQFIAHFAGKLGRFKILLYIPYEGVGVRYAAGKTLRPNARCQVRI